MDIKEKIGSILTEIVPGIDLASENLMEQSGVQSLTMIQIISELDIAFDIEITFEDIENENFRSLEAIEKMVKGYLK